MISKNPNNIKGRSALLGSARKSNDSNNLAGVLALFGTGILSQGREPMKKAGVAPAFLELTF
jgi:hypothetical protein